MEVIPGDVGVCCTSAFSNDREYRALAIFKGDRRIGTVVETECGVTFKQADGVVTLLPTMAVISYYMASFDEVYREWMEQTETGKEEA